MGWVRKFNDESLEILIAILRIVSIVAGIAFQLSVVAIAWTGSGRWFAVAMMLGLIAVASGVFGWVYWGNVSWKRKGAGNAGDH